MSESPPTDPDFIHIRSGDRDSKGSEGRIPRQVMELEVRVDAIHEQIKDIHVDVREVKTQYKLIQALFVEYALAWEKWRSKVFIALTVLTGSVGAIYAFIQHSKITL